MQLQDDIQRLKESRGIFNFRGKLVTRLVGGYGWRGDKYTTEIELLEAIKSAELSLENSIVVVNNGSINCINNGK